VQIILGPSTIFQKEKEEKKKRRPFTYNKNRKKSPNLRFGLRPPKMIGPVLLSTS
jgi:hypothetical protein